MASISLKLIACICKVGTAATLGDFAGWLGNPEGKKLDHDSCAAEILGFLSKQSGIREPLEDYRITVMQIRRALQATL